MIAILIFAALGLGALAFLLWFLVALLTEPKPSVNRVRRPADRSLTLVLMDRDRRNKRAA